MIRAALLSVLLASAGAAEPGLILVHGKVFLSSGRYAQAVAVSGNRIEAVGTDRAVLALQGPKTRVVDLKGRAVTPGFHDAHAHFFRGALSLTEADLTGAGSIADAAKRVKEFADANPGDGWILGRGWDQSAWDGETVPRHEDLDAAVSTRPVALTDAEGRKVWLNAEGMARAKLTSSTPSLIDGEIVREKGQPTGLLVGEAIAVATRVIPAPSKALKLEALRRALALARESGVTSIDSMAGPADFSASEQVELWRELRSSFTVRLFLYGRLDDPSGFLKLKRSAKDVARDRLDFVGLKGFVDGSLSDRTAALLAPYFDAKTSGALVHQAFVLNGQVRRAHEDGLQAALHAVGDRAVRAALDACQKSEEQARREQQVLPAYPCRIEHAEVIAPEDVPRLSALRAIASLQPARLVFERQDLNYNPNRLGSRVKDSFLWKSLEDSGALLAFGTDWPATPLSPRLGLYAATTRRNLDGKPEGGWMPQQRISLESAVEHYTEDAAKAVGHGDALGAIAPGRLADLAVFDRDIFAGADLLEAKIDMTVFDGAVVFERRR